MNNRFSLSDSQFGILLSCLNDTDAYNIPFIIELDEKLTYDIILNVLKTIYENHVAFKVVLIKDKGETYQTVGGFDLNIKYSEVDSIDKDKLIRPFNLYNSPLYRIEYIKSKEGCFLFFDFHHILFDGFSISQILKEFTCLLEGKNIAQESYSILDYVPDEKNISKDRIVAAKNYYSSIYDGIDIDSSLTDDKKDDTVSYASMRFELKSLSDKKIKDFIRSKNVKRSAFFQSVFAYTLSVFSYDNEVLFSTVNNGRNEKCKTSLGMFVKTIPMYINFEGVNEIDCLLTRTQDLLNKHIDNSIYPFTKLSEDYGLNSDILFSYQGDYYYGLSINGTKYNVEQIDRKDGKGNIALELFKNDDNYFINAEYRSDKYDEDSIINFLNSFEHYASEFLSKNNLDEFEKVNEYQLKILDSFNDRNLKDYDLSLTVVDMFEDNARKYPDKDCVVADGKHYTYKEVDILSNKIAGYIINNGYKKDDVASILIHRNAYILIASLGVLKAGLVYQPLDSGYPKERLNFMIKDSGATLLISEHDLSDIVDEYKGIILYLSDIDKLDEYNGKICENKSDDRFSLLYTSGSTGVPKGVQLSHENLSVFIQHFIKKYNVTRDEKWSAYASYGFDANMYDMYTCICAGATLYIIDEDMRLDLKKMNAYFEENGISSAFMTTQVGRQFAVDYQNKSLKRLLVGGEKLVPLTPPEYDFINLYGPTETTVCVTAYNVDKLYHRVPIGKGFDTVKLYVLDKNGRKVPYNACGELYIAGPQVALGYLNREDQNKIAFLTNHLDNDKHFSRMYKTGDIVRFLKDGTVDFIGRKDGQVKVRGFRIELTEVESIIRKYNGVKDATVNSYYAAVGGMYIAAFITSENEIDIEDLKAFIAENKPYYMVPEVIMQIDKIPLNQNGKVNKKALPTPTRKKTDIVLPTNETEKTLHDILKEILGFEEFGIKDDIYYLGLTSIASIKLITMINERLNKDIDLKTLKDNKTIENIAKILCEETKDEVYELLTYYPLSKTQEGIFVECVSKKDSTIYNIPVLYEFSKNVSIDKLINAIKTAINNHPYLKGTLFLLDDASIAIKRNDDKEVVVDIINVDGDKVDIRPEPFDLLKDNLYRVKIYLSEDKNYLLLDTHHILSDGTSLAVLLEDINLAYNDQPLEKEKLTGFDYALKERKESTPEELKKQKDYYQNLLSDIESMSLPRKDYNLPKESFYRSYETVIDLDIDSLNKFNEKHHITSNIFFNAVFAYTLMKFNGVDSSLYTTIYNGRSSLKLTRSVVMLVKTLPLFIRKQNNQDILSYIKDVKKQLEDTQEKTLYSFSELANDFNINADIMFAYQEDGIIDNKLANEEAKQIILQSSDAKSVFSLDLSLIGNKANLLFEYKSDYYLEDTMVSFAELFNLIAKQFISKNTFDELEYVDEKTIENMDVYNDTSDELDFSLTHVDLFVKACVENKNKKAVIGIDETLTYDDLHKASNKIANELIKHGVKGDDKVILLLPRIAHAYSATQGVLKSGAAYVPIDPAYPDERISYIIEDSNASILIATRKIYEEKAKNYNVRTLILEDILNSGDDTYNKVDIKPNDLAYCIYTSGSTGKPKGVMIEHHSLFNYVSPCKHNYVVWEYKDLCNVTVSLASLSFDLSVQEQMVPMANAMSVVLASEEEILNPLLLAKRMKENAVDYITTTPSYVNNVLDIDEVVEAFKNIKVLDIGAEALPTSLLRKMKEKGLNFRIHNGYGPTEATVACTMDFLTVDDTRITIGIPFNNVKTYIIDENNKRLPFGAVGELLIAGEGVARGYINNEALTKDKFITYNKLRAYKSGDLARLNYDGKIEFFGRKDNQVKLRGLRVELDEIENQINNYKDINRSVVLVKETKKDGQFLACYYTSNNEINIDDLKKEIGKTLTHYMIPKVFMRLENIPLTASGKVDKKALPEIEVQNRERVGREAGNDNQKKLKDIFTKVLGINEVYIDDDFFDLGGTSLSASKVIMLAMKEGLNISYSDVFDYPTIAMLDAFIRGNNKSVEKTENTVKAEKNISNSLKFNTLEYVHGIKKEFRYRNVLLTGITGFLGVHILKELLSDEDVNIITLGRSAQDITVEERIKGMLAYYFDNPYEEMFESRIKIVEADITDKNLIEKLKDYQFDLIINCAAIVKHFAKDDSIEKVNYGGVLNLIEVAKAYNARIVQISTTSIAGENINDKFDDNKRLHEYECFFGQDISNKYINSKIKGEEAILKAVEEDGLDGKIVRVGNLMGRRSDGEFQVNALTNNFMLSLKAYKALGVFPIDNADETIDFSPIDEVAKTILLFATTPKQYTVFHSASSHEVEMGNVVSALCETGNPIAMVDSQEFIDKLNEFIIDEEKSTLVSPLLNYESSDKNRMAKYILSSNKFSIKALYRLGYRWPIIDEEYIKQMINTLDTLGFFDL